LKNEEEHNLKSSQANIEYAKTLHDEKEEFNNLREQLDQYQSFLNYQSQVV